MSLRRKTLIALCIIAVVPLLLTAQLYAMFANADSKERAKDAAVSCAAIAKNAVEISTNSVLTDVTYLASLQSIEQYFTHRTAQSSEIYSLLLLYCINSAAINDIYITDAEYNVLISTNNDLVGNEMMPQKRQRGILQTGKPVLLGGSREYFSGIAPAKNGDGAILGYVGGTFDSTVFSTLSLTGDTENCFITIIDASGNVIASSSSYTFNRLNDLDNISDLSAKIIKNHSSDTTLPFFYTINGEERAAYVAQLDGSNWTVLCSYIYNEPQAPWVLLIIICVAVAFGLCFFIAKNVFGPLDTLLSGVKRLTDENYSQRLPYIRDGEFDGISSAFNALLARIEVDHKELLIKEKRHRIVNELSNSIIFEFNIETGLLECSPNGTQLAGYPECFDNFPLPFVNTETVHKDDAELFSNTFNEMLCGRHKGEIEIRLHNANGSYRWYQLLMTTITDDVTLRPLRIVGKLNDIDDERRSTDILRYKANRDSLTGLYNKGATHALILERLEMRRDNEHDALLIMDIDNFKRVNDGYGHQKGDSILAQVSAAISRTFRAEDIVGRMGGDEFMVMMCDVGNREIINSRAQKLVAAINKIPLDEENGDYMSLSVGIALCPQDGEEYDELYAAADTAAYATKHNGKNGFAFYDEK